MHVLPDRKIRVNILATMLTAFTCPSICLLKVLLLMVNTVALKPI